MVKKLSNNILLILLAAVLLYLTVSVFTDFNSLARSISYFDWFYLIILLPLSMLNYVTRFFKWHYYLHLLKVKINLKDSFLIFFSGLSMSVTPGKVGESLKSFLVKRTTGEPVSRTLPIIFAERVTDFLSLLLLAITGAVAYRTGLSMLILVFLFFILVIVIISNKNLSLGILNQLKKIKFIAPFGEKINSAYYSSYQLLKPRPLFFMTLLSAVSWFFECFGFYIILLNFKVHFSILLPTFIYSFATIAGALSMLPGGLGVTEGSLTYLLILGGLENEYAVAASFIVRIVTLWFAVLIGAGSLLLFKKKYGEIIKS